MEPSDFNPADLAVVGLIAVSGLFAFFRGLVREVLAVFAWVGAALVAVYGLPYARPYARQYIESEPLANGVAAVAIFLVALFFLAMISHAISNRVQDSALNAVDRTLGFLFGLARGAVLVCLGYLVIEWALAGSDKPDWLRSAKSLPFVERGAATIRRLLPADPKDAAAQAIEDAKRKAQQLNDDRKTFERLVSPTPTRAEAAKPDAAQPAKAGAPPAAQGYNPNERRDIDRIIRNTQ